MRVADAWSAADPSSAAGKRSLGEIRTAAGHVRGSRVGGSPSQDADFISALYGRNLLLIVAAIVIVTLALLSRALRSAWLPVKALLLNLVSLAAAFGVLTFIWQQGHGTSALFSSPATGAITLWVPLAVFSLLFGLSMDYEVFILTRIREEYDAGHKTREATIRGVGHTGRLVTSGAIILCLAFIALGGVPQTDVKILSTGLAAGVLIDATIIRGVLGAGAGGPARPGQLVAAGPARAAAARAWAFYGPSGRRGAVAGGPGQRSGRRADRDTDSRIIIVCL